MPSELRRDAAALQKQVELEDDNTAVPRTHIDDEYANAALRDPKVLITTSRDPSSRLTQFAKELKLVIPSALRINRGGQVISLNHQSCMPAPAVLLALAIAFLRSVLAVVWEEREGVEREWGSHSMTCGLFGNATRKWQAMNVLDPRLSVPELLPPARSCSTLLQRLEWALLCAGPASSSTRVQASTCMLLHTTFFGLWGTAFARVF